MRLPARDRWRHWVLDPLEGARLAATHNLLRALPTDAVSRFGEWLGPIAARRYPLMNERVRRGLRTLRPDLVPDEAAMDRAVRRVWRSQGRLHAEFAAHEKMWREGRVAVEGGEHLDALRSMGRRFIVAGVHLSNWEIIPIALGFLGHRFVMTYQPRRNRFEDRIAEAARTRTNALIHAADPDADFGLLPPSRAAGPGLLRALRGGASFVMFVDEYTGGQVHAPSFGRPPRTDGNMARIVRLARLADAAVVPAYVIRGDGARFTVRFLPPLGLRDTRDADADLHANMSLLDDALEPAVRDHLEQWYMLIYLRLP